MAGDIFCGAEDVYSGLSGEFTSDRVCATMH